MSTDPSRVPPSPLRPLALIGIAATGIVLAAAFGALVNGINAGISADYYVHALDWQGLEHVHRAAIARGIFDGLLFGLPLSAVVTLVIGVASRAACPYTTGLGYLAGVVIAAVVCWLAGGLVGVGLAALSPEFFERTFRPAEAASDGLLAYAWVGGSIAGAAYGAVLAVLVTCIVFAARWRRRGSAAQG